MPLLLSGDHELNSRGPCACLPLLVDHGKMWHARVLVISAYTPNFVGNCLFCCHCTSERAFIQIYRILCSGGSVAEWLACWTQAQKASVQIAVATLSGNSLRQTVHIRRSHQAAKLVAALLRVAAVTAGLAESSL